MSNNFHNNETDVGLPTVPSMLIPAPISAPPANPPVDAYAALNWLLDNNLITAIVQCRKVEFRCSHFAPLADDWMVCTVDDPMGNESGGEMKIEVRGWTPIIVYMGAHQTPFTVQ